MTWAAVGLGANLGDAVATVRGAIDLLGCLPHSRLVRASRLYRTPAWGVIAQPDFINAVANRVARLLAAPGSTRTDDGLRFSCHGRSSSRRG